jgi:hypothetical protein
MFSSRLLTRRQFEKRRVPRGTFPQSRICPRTSMRLLSHFAFFKGRNKATLSTRCDLISASRTTFNQSGSGLQVWSPVSDKVSFNILFASPSQKHRPQRPESSTLSHCLLASLLVTALVLRLNREKIIHRTSRRSPSPQIAPHMLQVANRQFGNLQSEPQQPRNSPTLTRRRAHLRPIWRTGASKRTSHTPHVTN